MTPRRSSRTLAVLVVALAMSVVGTSTLVAQPDPAPMRPPDPVDPGSGSGSSGSGSGSAGSSDPGSGAGSAGSAAGSGSAGSAAGSGSGARIIQLPMDVNAPAVNAAASPTTVRIGGKFTVFITATFAEGVEVNLREPIELGSIFEVTRKLSQDKPAGDGRRTREWQLEVIAWELGDLVMPPIPITYTAFGNVGEVPTNAIRLMVVGVLGELIDDPKAMRADAAPTDIIVRDWFWLYVGGGVLVGLVALFVTIWIVRKRRRKTVRLVGAFGVRPRRIDMTSERALERLLAIERSGVLDRDDDRKEGYGQMVEVIRDYLGARYRVATLDLTSSELVRALRDVAPPPELGLVEKWLDTCDLVKYGGLKTGAAGARQTLEDARALVVTTTQLAQSESSRKAESGARTSASEARTSASGARTSASEPRTSESGVPDERTTPFVREDDPGTRKAWSEAMTEPVTRVDPEPSSGDGDEAAIEASETRPAMEQVTDDGTPREGRR